MSLSVVKSEGFQQGQCVAFTDEVSHVRMRWLLTTRLYLGKEGSVEVWKYVLAVGFYCLMGIWIVRRRARHFFVYASARFSLQLLRRHPDE